MNYFPNIDLQLPMPMTAIITKPPENKNNFISSMSTVCRMFNHSKNEKITFWVSCEATYNLNTQLFESYIWDAYKLYGTDIWNNLYEGIDSVFENEEIDTDIDTRLTFTDPKISNI